MHRLRKILENDLLEKYSIIRNEAQTSYLTIDYLSNLRISSGFFDSSLCVADILLAKIKKELDKEIKNILDYSNIDSIWVFINKRALILRLYKKYIDIIGILQKSLTQRLFSLPQLYPSPPLLREQEIFRALKIVDKVANEYYQILKEINGERICKQKGEILPVWDYTVDDKFETLLSDEGRKNLIKATYWIMLLPNYLPILAHEIAHTFITEEEEIWESLNLKVIEENARTFLFALFHSDNFTNFARNLITEIIADFQAVIVAGLPYIFSVFLYLTSEKINYRISGFTQGFPILRLKLMAYFALEIINKKPKIFPSDFVETINSIIQFCEQYYELLSKPELAISQKIIVPEPDINKLCALKRYIDNSLFNILFRDLVDGLSKNINIAVKKWDYNHSKIQEMVKKFFEDKKYLSYQQLEESRIINPAQIPILLWQYILSEKRDLKRYETGRLCQEAFRVILEKHENEVFVDGNKIKFYLGEIVEFLFMKINWSSFNFKEERFSFHEVLNNSLDKIKKGIEKNQNKNQSKMDLFGPYYCIGSFDVLSILNNFSVKKLTDLSWPPKIGINEAKEIKYFPKSEVFQEILFENNPFTTFEYAKNIDSFLKKAHSLCLYQIKLRLKKSNSNNSKFEKNERDDSLNSLANSITLSIENFKERKSQEKIELFFLKSIGWEDLVILIKNFNSLNTIKEFKGIFSSHLEHSLTTFFYKKESKENEIKNVSIGNSKIMTLLKVGNYQKLYSMSENEKYKFEILAGIYDAKLEWNLNPEDTIEKLDNHIFEFIEQYNDPLFIIDINTLISFPKNRDKNSAQIHIIK